MYTKIKKIGFGAMLLLGIGFIVMSCGDASNEKKDTTNIQKKIGLLLVNHGSRSESWRQTLLHLEASVRDSILSEGKIGDIKTAFMEYNEPSIATRLKEFDSAGYSDVVIVPIFLTVSPHTFEDLPTIIGQKENPESKESLKLEKIERYTPKAKTYIAPTLDFADMLKKNVLRRVEALSQNPQQEGLVLIGYGDEAYNKEWEKLFSDVGDYVKAQKGISEYSYGWCGHLVHYKPEPTTTAIHQVLKNKQTALVIPVLVATDEMFQVKIIGDGIHNVKNAQERVKYKPDAILPDTNINNWVISVAREYADKINTPVAKK